MLDEAINRAKEALLDPDKRKIYDQFIQENPPLHKASVPLFSEDFAENAFDKGDNNAVQNSYDRMTRYIKAFFGVLEGRIDFDLVNLVENINRKIEAENTHRGVPLSLYTVPEKKLLFYQYGQRRIYASFRVGVLDDADAQRQLSWLQEHFTKTRQMGLYSWPAAWDQLLMRPLRLGLCRVQQRLLEMEDDSALSNTNDDDDVEMEDIDEEAERYVPTQHWSNGESVITSIRLLVKVNGVNPIKVVLGVDDAALAYHQLPKHKRNNVKENAVKYAKMIRADFVGIIGVASVASTSPSRLPDTYVWVETKTVSDQPQIVTRSILRDWLGKGLADRRIDSWFKETGITPEWTLANNSRRRLTYPSPGQSGNPNLRSRIQRSGIQSPPSSEDGGIEALTKTVNDLAGIMHQMQLDAQKDRKQQRELFKAYLPAPDSEA
ncbi:hypothetical protein NUW58_g1256 [Xylaria curta]|uniref:Uncharacterized protein n=2 Tax=Xylaria curta TaxID=42375 RepID=A0ACC1PEZ1_9PEZI|nr:hypothetical protein NUW58_g2569 [Xylaria curta]KAJ2995493.1 hypothetical protein NUW58_g1256 [Xylaria curta]